MIPASTQKAPVAWRCENERCRHRLAVYLPDGSWRLMLAIIRAVRWDDYRLVVACECGRENVWVFDKPI